MQTYTDKEKFYINWVLQQFKAMGASKEEIETEKMKLMFENGYLNYNLNFLNFNNKAVK